jgi:MFS family permease
MRQGPLAGRYPAAAAMVIFALVPYLGLSAALQPLTPMIGEQLHMSAQTMSLAFGLANAGYAVGTVLAVQFAQILPQRRMMVVYAAFLVLGSVLAAGAQDPAMFIVGHVLQGLCTSLLLIAAVPPLAIGFGLPRIRSTAVIMNVCIFGAVALGPAIGGIQANAHAWRPLFWIIAAISLAALILSVLTFEDAPPADPRAPRDPVALGLAASGCVAAFFGASELLTHRFLEPLTLGPLIVGLGLIVALIVNQSRARRPLLTIGSMLSSTIPVAGIVVALAAAAAAVTATGLTAGVLAPHYSPLHLGLLFLPELAGALLTAVSAAYGYGVPGGRDRRVPHSGPADAGAYADRLGADRHRPRRVGCSRAVRGRLLASGRKPAAGIRDRRAAPRRRGVHGRSSVRPYGRDRRGEPQRRHRDRSVDRPRDRDKRRGRRGPALRPRRCTSADARPRALHERRRARLVLATATGRRPRAPTR